MGDNGAEEGVGDDDIDGCHLNTYYVPDMVLDADVHQTVEQNSPPEDPGSSTGAVTHQLCYLGRLLNLSVPWRPRLSRELMIRQESSASGGCREDPR